MGQLFFTADTHFGHKNIIEHANRPFANVLEMNETMVNRWNSVVGRNDTVYHLGDVGYRISPRNLADILDRLNGTLILIAGNHDKGGALRHSKCRDRFAVIHDFGYELEFPEKGAPRGRRLIVLCHYKMATWNVKHWGQWHLFGHSHGAIPDNPTELAFDVGVDCHDFAPISYTRVCELMAAKTWTPPFKARGQS